MTNINEIGQVIPTVHFTREDLRAIRGLATSKSSLCGWQTWDHGFTEDEAEEWVSLAKASGRHLLLVRTSGGQCAMIDDEDGVVAEASSMQAVVNQALTQGGAYV